MKKLCVAAGPGAAGELRDVLLEVVKRFAIVASSNKCPDDATGLSNYLRIRSKTNRAGLQKHFTLTLIVGEVCEKLLMVAK